MNFALLGNDRAAWPLLRAIAADPRHRLVTAAYLGSARSELQGCLEETRLLEGWEELLVEPRLDAVIVCGNHSAVLEGAKQIAAQQIPLILFPRADQGINFAYELTLIRDQQQTVLFPILPGRFSPAVHRLCRLIGDGELGPVALVRTNHACRAINAKEPADRLTNVALHNALLQDALLLRTVAGEYHQITCLLAGTTDAGCSQATVTLAGRSAAEAVCSYQPAESTDVDWQIRVQADRGSAELIANRDGAGWTLTIAGESGEVVTDTPQQVNHEESTAGDEMLRQFERAVQAEQPTRLWSDVVWGFDLLDAAARSVKRRRTIDLHFEMPSERAAFKSQMTAVGCGVLMLTPVLAIGLLIVGALFDVPPMLMKIGRVIVFAPLFLYLLLQGFLLLTSPSSE